MCIRDRLYTEQLVELENIAKDKGLILMNGIKTAYATAYYLSLIHI